MGLFVGRDRELGIGEAREVRKETEETGGNELERARKKGKEERTLMGLGKWHEWERFEKKEKQLRFELFRPNRTNH